MEFLIDEADNLNIHSSKISKLLNEVYVGGNYIEPNVAANLFEASAVKNRGVIICALEKQSLSLAGCVVFVSSNSPACQLAKENESEMHLLCVSTKFRNEGLGKLLITSAIDMAQKNGHKKMILWTQQSMKAAQKLYLNCDFKYIKNITKNNREFLVYEKTLNT